jgi:hypothetical protein
MSYSHSDSALLFILSEDDILQVYEMKYPGRTDPGLAAPYALFKFLYFSIIF